MPWFKVDDGFHGHPKVVELSLTAVGLWALSGSWCAKYLTDGAVSDKAISRIGGDDTLAAELVAAGLWLVAAEGYEFKDWAEYQPLKVDVEAERAAAQERMRAVRAKKKGVRTNDTRTDPERSDEQSQNFGRSSADVRVTPSQSHPIPVPEKDMSSEAEPKEPYSAAFSAWYQHYPRKESKGDAYKAWEVLRRARQLPTNSVLVASADRYTRTQDPQFYKLPGGWLRDRKWEDEKVDTKDSWTGKEVFGGPDV
ncbi:hypothetical protein [Subtercola vilae]|uniref:hypothetical protein n=1 Tax=Subtercola vilae TaxID=2056433 RepID=UPI0010AA2E79|nr:hypothetical protein [Subtercola vilae]